MINLSFIPRREGLPVAESCSMEVLLKISPSAGGETISSDRPPLNLALVIDKSGSMAGRPLHEAKRCAEMVLDRLAHTDRLAIVAYDDQVEVLIKSSPVEDKTRFRQALTRIRDGGMTNLHGGWEVGATEVAGSLLPGRISRVLLLSDGQANQGLTDPHVIESHCAELAAADVTTSTYGLGESFNEDLMAKMARAGQGQAHYGRSAEDLIDPFQQEFDLLSALIARKLRLHLDPEHGVKVSVLNLFSQDAETGAYILPDLASGGELWALLRIEVDAQVSIEKRGPVRILTARLSWVDREDRPRQSDPAPLYLNPLSATLYAALPENPSVRDRSVEIEVARLADEARDAARHGDWRYVEDMTAQMSAIASGNEWAEQSVRSLKAIAVTQNRESFSKEALYKASRMRSRMASFEESDANWSLEREALKPSYLRRKGEEGRRFDLPVGDRAGARNDAPSSQGKEQKPSNPASNDRRPE